MTACVLPCASVYSILLLAIQTQASVQTCGITQASAWTRMHSKSSLPASSNNILLHFPLVIDARTHNAEHFVAANVCL